MSTVDPQVAPCHEATRLADEENRGSAVLMRVAEAVEHVTISPICSPLGILVEQRFRHGSHDVPGGNGVDTNAVLAPLRGKISSQLDDRCFRSIIRPEP